MVNSFQELEEEYAEECKKVTGRKVWCIGLVSLYKKENLDEAQRGSKNHSNDENQYCLKWLDSQKPGSVMYDCLGSLNRLTPPHLAEFRLGLEASKRAFIWVMRDGYRKEEIENWLVEDGFEERVGVRVRAEMVVLLWEEEKCGLLVNKDRIKEAIDKVMNEGK
ncbi:UDP-glycosyltransferase 73C7-like [Ziziphus jujuba]|uniref:UDP-glycosyltransferase 73C7-like n=1 Tax=Ziziphus jujuba TaxID=326968 RepID=A0ABM3I5U4_ZIZJJ|nr:UDP-glycosyltransferase 73C7-like [Ziziphus jujuba]